MGIRDLEKRDKLKRIWSSQNIFLYNRSTKNKYNNILSNKNFNFYCIDSIYSAPSVKENRLEINKLLKYKKLKRMNYLNNIHNNIMIKESKLYRQKFISATKENSFETETKNNLKRKYNMNDMNEIINIKKNLQPYFKGQYIVNDRKRYFSSYGLSINKYKCLKPNIISNDKKNLNSFNDYSLSTNKTNYFSKFLSGRKSKKTINEKKTNKTNDFNYINNTNNIISAGTVGTRHNKSKKYKKLELL